MFLLTCIYKFIGFTSFLKPLINKDYKICCPPCQNSVKLNFIKSDYYKHKPAMWVNSNACPLREQYHKAKGNPII